MFSIPMKFLIFIIVLSFSFGMVYGQSKLNLMPMPKKIELVEGAFSLNENFRISFDSFNSENLSQYSTRFLKHLSNKTGLFFPNIYFDVNDNPLESSMIIKVSREANIKLGENENYILEVTSDKIYLTAETELGAYRGMETVLQLLNVDNKQYIIPSLKISDEPRFPWRGLMLDVARHFMPVDVIKRNIDAMASVKLNVLHLHLCDDQGFRIECKTFPKLHENASDGLFFTQNQIKDIIDYAGKRGIRVVPEFDMPGHGTSFITAYPELGSKDMHYSLERRFGILDPTLNPINDYTYEFLSQFFNEMKDIFPDEYMHIGGDENDGNHWNENEEIKSFKSQMGYETILEMQNYFSNKVLKILTECGKKMIGWDEILVPGLPKNVVIQSWRGKEALISAAKTGYQVMLSNGYYIDLIQPTEYHYLNNPVTDDMNLTKEQEKMILGGEATMWAEYISHETIDSRIWPRTAAIAERFWSPSNINDVDDMHRRLEFIEYHLEEFGLLHLKNRDMLLRRLSNNQNIEPLKILISAIEPLKEYERGGGREYTTFSPLSRLVDAAYPDPRAVRVFNKNVSKYLQEHATKDIIPLLKSQLTIWGENHEKMIPIIYGSPILNEIESLSYDLTRTSQIGLEALKSISEGTKQSENWKRESTKILDDCRRPRGESEIMIINSIQKLVDTAP